MTVSSVHLLFLNSGFCACWVVGSDTGMIWRRKTIWSCLELEICLSFEDDRWRRNLDIEFGISGTNGKLPCSSSSPSAKAPPAARSSLMSCPRPPLPPTPLPTHPVPRFWKARYRGRRLVSMIILRGGIWVTSLRCLGGLFVCCVGFCIHQLIWFGFWVMGLVLCCLWGLWLVFWIWRVWGLHCGSWMLWGGDGCFILRCECDSLFLAAALDLGVVRWRRGANVVSVAGFGICDVGVEDGDGKWKRLCWRKSTDIDDTASTTSFWPSSSFTDLHSECCCLLDFE